MQHEAQTYIIWLECSLLGTMGNAL